MRVLLQRVSRAAVAVDGAERGAVGRGFLALVGVTHEDDVAAAAQARRQDGAAARVRRRRRPHEPGARRRRRRRARRLAVHAVRRRAPRQPAELHRRGAARSRARPSTRPTSQALRAEGVPVETGVFGAHMHVELVNDGPVTILLRGLTRAMPGSWSGRTAPPKHGAGPRAAEGDRTPAARTRTGATSAPEQQRRRAACRRARAFLVTRRWRASRPRSPPACRASVSFSRSFCGTLLVRRVAGEDAGDPGEQPRTPTSSTGTASSGTGHGCRCR